MASGNLTNPLVMVVKNGRFRTTLSPTQSNTGINFITWMF